jgi:hypothetical protein
MPFFDPDGEIIPENDRSVSGRKKIVIFSDSKNFSPERGVGSDQETGRSGKTDGTGGHQHLRAIMGTGE